MPAFSLVPSPDGTGDRTGKSAVAHGEPEPERVHGTVVQIDGGIASVLVGPELEPWDFPVEMLPSTVGVESVLVLERTGRRLRFVELDPVTEVVRGRPFDLRLRRTARKVPYMHRGLAPDTTVHRAP